MPNKCAAVSCKSGYDGWINLNGITFHKFPADESVLKKWLRRIFREDYKVTVHSRLCSIHFQEIDFVSESSDTNSTRRTKKKAGLQKRCQ